MHWQYYILVLCLFLLGGSIGAQDEDWWGDNHAPHQDELYFDDQQSAQTFEGSADDEVAGSGYGSDDEDDEDEGSGYKRPLTKCQQLQEQMEYKKVSGAYIPLCTDDGMFQKIQCHASTNECWCVDRQGKEIGGTVTRTPAQPNCDNVNIQPIPKPRPEGGFDDKDDHPVAPTSDTNEGVGFEPPETDPKNKVEPNPDVEVKTVSPVVDKDVLESKQEGVERMSIMGQPGILAGIIGGAVVGLLCAVLLVMFIVYRMRKKDEGSYALDEPKRSPQHAYTRAKNQEFFA